MLSLMRKNIGKLIMAMGITIAFLLASITPLHAQQAASRTSVYSADLKTVNDTLPGNKAKGRAEIRVTGDEMLITVNAEGLPPKMMIIQHLHGFKDGKKATCATMKEDANKDGIVDVKESEQVTGVELIPLNNKVEKLDMKDKSYPKSSEQGTLQYSKKVSLKKLQDALKKNNDMTNIQLENMVINLHGVAKDTKLPSTVKSVMKLPPAATVPVACGEIKKAQQ